MSDKSSRRNGSIGDENGGFEGPDVERTVREQPVIDAGDSELDDSADSYVSPARRTEAGTNETE